MLWGRCRMAELSDFEVRSAVAVLDNGLTIDDCRLAFEARGSADDRGITVAPIKSIAGEDPRSPALNQHLAAIAVVFDFVNPVLPLRRLIDGGSELGLDEPELISYAEHDAWIDYVPVRRRGIASDFS